MKSILASLLVFSFCAVGMTKEASAKTPAEAPEPCDVKAKADKEIQDQRALLNKFGILMVNVLGSDPTVNADKAPESYVVYTYGQINPRVFEEIQTNEVENVVEFFIYDNASCTLKFHGRSNPDLWIK